MSFSEEDSVAHILAAKGDPHEFYTADEIAHFLNISRRTVINALDSGELLAHGRTTGKRTLWRIALAHVVAWYDGVSVEEGQRRLERAAAAHEKCRQKKPPSAVVKHRMSRCDVTPVGGVA